MEHGKIIKKNRIKSKSKLILTHNSEISNDIHNGDIWINNKFVHFGKKFCYHWKYK